MFLTSKSYDFKKLLAASGSLLVEVRNGQAVKVSIPPLTKDKRAQYVKLAKDYAEKTKVAVRNVRQAAMKKIKGLKSDLPEDTARGMEKDVEAMVKKMNGDIDA